MRRRVAPRYPEPFHSKPDEENTWEHINDISFPDRRRLEHKADVRLSFYIIHTLVNQRLIWLKTLFRSVSKRLTSVKTQTLTQLFMRQNLFH